MGIMVSKDESNSDLDRRISADLRARAQSSARKDPDYVDDAVYIEGTKKTSRFTWVWWVLIVLAAVSLLCIIFI